MTPPLYPSLYEIHVRPWLHDFSRTLGGPATLDDVPDEALDRIAALGFDWVWLMGVWKTGRAGRDVSLAHEGWREEYARTLPDFHDWDVTGSPFAVRDYTVHGDFGGPEALTRLRRRLAQRGVKLMLDFVPNHMALDHAWAKERPEFFVGGTDADLQREPGNYRRVETARGPKVLAHGRDPYFPGWPDTLQLNYRHAGMRQALARSLSRIAAQCDGLRCDMAMLVLPDVFARTWGDASRPSDGTTPQDSSFWAEVIPRLREQHPGFAFMAEAYWDLEWELQQQGFDYTYDKRLYDRLRAGDVAGARGHLGADLDYQRKSVRFVENHDEPRAAAVFPSGVQQAAAVATYLTPGLRFFHDGQFEGRQVRLSVHLARRPDEPVDADLPGFYVRLLDVLKRPEVRSGRWRLLECRPAWDGNPSCDRYLAYLWERDGRRLLVAVNYGPSRGQCRLPLPIEELSGQGAALKDLIGDWRYERAGDELATSGLYVDLPEWGYHVFELTTQ